MCVPKNSDSFEQVVPIGSWSLTQVFTVFSVVSKNSRWLVITNFEIFPLTYETLHETTFHLVTDNFNQERDKVAVLT